MIRIKKLNNVIKKVKFSINKKHFLLGKTCDGCKNGEFIFHTRSIGHVLGRTMRYQYKIINYPHITCECCAGVYHLNYELKCIYEYMEKIGERNALKDDSYIVDFNMYKNKFKSIIN